MDQAFTLTYRRCRFSRKVVEMWALSSSIRQAGLGAFGFKVAASAEAMNSMDAVVEVKRVIRIRFRIEFFYIGQVRKI